MSPQQSPHPFTNIIPDCITLIFSYHIHAINQPYASFPRASQVFFRKYIYCWEFSSSVNVREFLLKTRGCKLKLQYVRATSNESVDNETFKLFRGIRELDVQQVWRRGPFTDEALENLRGIETLNISFNPKITSAAFVNLRGVKTLRIAGLTNLDDSALEQLRGVQKLDISDCLGFTDAGMANLRNIKVLTIANCTQLSDACFENFRGVRELHMIACNQPMLTSAAFVNLRGIKVLNASWCEQVSGDALRNLTGVHALELMGCQQITDSDLQHLVGVKKLNLSGCNKVIGSGLQYIRGVQTINILQTGITEKVDFSPLREATFVGVTGLTFSEQMLSNFRRAKVFDTFNCRFSDDEAFANLANVVELELVASKLFGLTDDAFRHLKSLQLLEIKDCRGQNFTKRLLEYLPCSLRELYISDTDIPLRDEDVDDAVRCLSHISVLDLPMDSVWKKVLKKVKELQTSQG